MKDRQAQLEQNIVAENLASFFKKIEPYSKLILSAVVVVVVVFIGYGLYSNEQTYKRSDATIQLLMNNPEVADTYPDTAAAAWSQLFQANDNLAQGIGSLYQDRDEAESLLNQAKEQFSQARRSSDDPILVSRASYGLGIAAESLGQIDEAVEAFKQTVAANESEQMVKVAQQRIDRLSNDDSADFLAWFSEQDFSPADPSLPPELPGESALPDLPNLEMSNLGDSLPDSEGPSTPIEGGIELPPVGENTETPAETPAEETGESSEGEAEMKLEGAAPAEEAAAPETAAAEEAAAEEPADADAPADE